MAICSTALLIEQACNNNFVAAANDVELYRAIKHQLLCNISANGTGGASDFADNVQSGNYAGGAPTFTPASGTGIGFDTSDGSEWHYWSGNWH